MKNSLLVLSLMLATSMAHAAANEKENDIKVEKKIEKDFDFEKREKRGGPCKELELSAEQEKTLREERFKFESEEIDLEAKIRHAKLNLEKISADAKSTVKEAKSAASEMAVAIAAKISSEEQFKTEILFKLYKNEQREKAAQCGFLMGGPMDNHRAPPHKDREEGPGMERFAGGPEHEGRGPH